MRVTHGPSSVSEGGLPRLLVVDDNPLNLELVKFVLNEDICRLEAAANADEALQLVDSFHPQLILMDIQLPGMNGLELTQRLKTDPETRHIVVLAFTAYAMKGDADKMLAAGCDGYISKPIEVATFARQVLLHLERERPGT